MNEKSDKSVKIKSYDELFEHELNGRPIKDIILEMTEFPRAELTGGRGSSSGQMQDFSFGHAVGSGSLLDISNHVAAEMNVKIKTKTPEEVMKVFRKQHVDSDHEWAVVVDSDGYVHSYSEGGSTSVMPGYADGKQMIIHNHPSDGETAFSDSDLISMTMPGGGKGVVASSANWDYVVEKGGHFKANEFVKAVKHAKLRGTDYSDAVHRWLTANAKKYGYSYHRKYYPTGKGKSS